MSEDFNLTKGVLSLLSGLAPVVCSFSSLVRARFCGSFTRRPSCSLRGLLNRTLNSLNVTSAGEIGHCINEPLAFLSSGSEPRKLHGDEKFASCNKIHHEDSLISSPEEM